jgi:hypothetical protein
LQRFAIILGQPPTAARLITPTAEATAAAIAYDEIIDTLCDLEGCAYHTTDDGTAIIQQMERDGLDYATVPDYGSGFQGFCGKLHGTLARVTLLLRLLDDGADNNIPTSTVRRADRLVRQFILPHTTDFYSAVSPEAEQIRAIAAWLLTEAPTTFRPSDIGRHVRSCRDLGRPALNRVLEPFVTGAWLTPTNPFPNNDRWKLDLRVRTALAARIAIAQELRERGRALRDQINRGRITGELDDDLEENISFKL